VLIEDNCFHLFPLDTIVRLNALPSGNRKDEHPSHYDKQPIISKPDGGLWIVLDLILFYCSDAMLLAISTT
jgi:hypothetical protein